MILNLNFLVPRHVSEINNNSSRHRNMFHTYFFLPMRNRFMFAIINSWNIQEQSAVTLSLSSSSIFIPTISRRMRWKWILNNKHLRNIVFNLSTSKIPRAWSKEHFYDICVNSITRYFNVAKNLFRSIYSFRNRA